MTTMEDTQSSLLRLYRMFHADMTSMTTNKGGRKRWNPPQFGFETSKERAVSTLLASKRPDWRSRSGSPRLMTTMEDTQSSLTKLSTEFHAEIALSSPAQFSIIHHQFSELTSWTEDEWMESTELTRIIEFPNSISRITFDTSRERATLLASPRPDLRSQNMFSFRFYQRGPEEFQCPENLCFLGRGLHVEADRDKPFSFKIWIPESDRDVSDDQRDADPESDPTLEISSAHGTGSFGESGWEQSNDSVHVLNTAELSGESTIGGLQLRPTREPHKFTWISQSEPSEVSKKYSTLDCEQLLPQIQVGLLENSRKDEKIPNSVHRIQAEVTKIATDERILPQIQVGLLEKSRKDEKSPIDMTQAEEVSSAHRAGSFRESAWEEENDSVHVLKSAELSRKSTLDCVFFHGLQLRPTREPHKFTWISQSEPSEVWLKWLHEIHPTMRIIAVSYDASMKKDSKNGCMDLYQVAENLLSKLILAGVGQSGPIIFVGHNFGGIIAKAISRQAHFRHSLYENDTDITDFLENLRGLFYFGVPHRGSSFIDIVEQLSIVQGQLVDYVKVSSKELSRLNEDHDALCKRYDWKVAGVGESLPTNLGNGFYGVIVDKASARCRNFMIVDEDHSSICQPESRNSTSYLHLKEFIDRIQAQVTKTATDEQVLPQIQVGLLEKSRKDEEFQQQLVKHTALGFWGMVGVGKTTLCKAIFNDLWNAFPYTLFAEGVKQIPGDEREFEETVLSLVHHKGKKITPAPNLVQLRGKKLLVAFDDVEKDREIDLLKKLSRTLLDSSRYIVTSQNRQMLNKIDGINISEVAPLDGEDSKLLFKTLAFPDNLPLQEWQTKWMEAIVQTCGGLPLTLEIVANYLKGCDSLDVWQQMPEYVGNVVHGETVGLSKVWMQLKTSYDNLGPEEKQMFLEAATFFQERFVENNGWRPGQRQWTLSEAKVIWSMMHGNEALHWRALVDRSMVSDVEDDSAIRIHELLKGLGHSLADTDDFKIRVDSVENLLMILQDGKRKIKNVHTLQVVCKDISGQFSSRKLCFKCFKLQRGWTSHCEHLSQRLPLHKLCNMKSLRCLQLVDCEIEKGKVTLPRSVVVFRSQNSGKYISFGEASPLVYLSMKAFRIKRLPESVCGLSNLHFLNLEAGNLLSLPDNFGSLKKLRQLKLVTQKLKRLPDFFSSLQDLQKVHLECDRLKFLPESIGHLRQLRELNLQCQTLVSLPSSFGELHALQELSLRCNSLEILPDRFCELVGLQKLELRCDKLQSLPESSARLTQLTQLILVCRKLRWLPRSFDELEALQDLDLQCDSLESLPESLRSRQAHHTPELR